MRRRSRRACLGTLLRLIMTRAVRCCCPSSTWPIAPIKVLTFAKVEATCVAILTALHVAYCADKGASTGNLPISGCVWVHQGQHVSRDHVSPTN